MPERDEGVIKKYDVIRLNDPTGKHDNCWFFVLDPEHDPLAQKALLAYADAAKAAGYQQLRDDLYDRVMGVQKEQRRRCSEGRQATGWVEVADVPRGTILPTLGLGQVRESGGCTGGCWPHAPLDEACDYCGRHAASPSGDEVPR